MVLLILLGGSYAAGYFTRDYISRKRRANANAARTWQDFIEPDQPRPANSNRPPEMHGDLGQMLSRWEDRARARRAR